MRASIAIPTHNEGERLLKTVAACLRAIERLDCEIVVADDASSDGSIERLRKAHPEVKVFSSEERKGCPATKDLAARYSQGDVLIFVDAHCKPKRYAIERLIEDVELWHGDAVISPRIVALNTDTWKLDLTSPTLGYWADLEWFHSGWCRSSRLTSVVGPGGRRFFEQSAMAGCCLAVSRTLYEKLGGFDRDMLSWGMEDLDFGLKCWLMGHCLLIDPYAIIGHRFATGPLEYSVPLDHLLVNRLRTARKNFEDTAWKDWCRRHRAFYPARIWASAWRLFEETRASAEAERERMERMRPLDIYQYAFEFGYAWPLTLATSPYPPPVVPYRARWACPFEDTKVVRTTHFTPDEEPCGDEPDEEEPDQDEPDEQEPTEPEPDEDDEETPEQAEKASRRTTRSHSRHRRHAR